MCLVGSEMCIRVRFASVRDGGRRIPVPGGLDVEKMSVDIALWGLYIRACGTGRVSPEEPGMPGPVECLMPRPCASESGVEIALPSKRVAGV